MENKQEKRLSMDSDSIYLMWIAGSDRYKIGYSKDPGQRKKQIQTSHIDEVVLIASKPYQDAKGKESELHARYAQHRVNGEWFKLPPTVTLQLLKEFGFSSVFCDYLANNLTLPACTPNRSLTPLLDGFKTEDMRQKNFKSVGLIFVVALLLSVSIYYLLPLTGITDYSPFFEKAILNLTMLLLGLLFGLRLARVSDVRYLPPRFYGEARSSD